MSSEKADEVDALVSAGQEEVNGTTAAVKRKIAYAKAPQKIVNDSDNIDANDSLPTIVRQPLSSAGKFNLPYVWSKHSTVVSSLHS